MTHLARRITSLAALFLLLTGALLVQTARTAAGAAGPSPVPRSAPAESWIGIARLADPETDDQMDFGWSLAMSGNIAVVGAPSQNRTLPGTVYVFERPPGDLGNWHLTQQLETGEYDSYLGWAVDTDGRTIVVTAKTGFIGPYWVAGEAYVFERTGNEAEPWVLTGRLTHDGTALFGYNVAIDGDTIAVAAPPHEIFLVPGRVYLFQRNAVGRWELTGRLDAPAGEPGDKFAFSVAVQQDTLVVSAPPANAAYVFQRSDLAHRQWSYLQKLTPDRADTTKFGQSLALEEDMLLVGAPVSNWRAGSSRGTATLFRRDAGGDSSWHLVQTLTIPTEDPDIIFGKSVTISDDRLIVGAPPPYATHDRAHGAVYVFTPDPAQPDRWSLSERLLANGPPGHSDEFGFVVSADGDTLAVSRGTTSGPQNAIHLFAHFPQVERRFLPVTPR